MEVRKDVMEFLGMHNEEGEPVESIAHSKFSLYGPTNDQPKAIQEQYYNWFDEERSWPVASPDCGGFEEDFNPPLYDKYEDSYAEDEGPKWDVSSCSSNS